MNKLIKTSIIVILSIIFTNTVLGQKPKYDEQITITAPYEPSVSDANKISSEPGNISLEVEKDKLDYQTTSFNITTTDLTISGVSLPDFKYYDEIHNKHIFYSKLGFGSNIEPLAHIIVNSVDNKAFGGGFALKHHSAWKQLDSVLNNSFSNSYINGYGKFTINNQQLKIGGFYNHDLIHYFGIDILNLENDFSFEDLKKETENIKQVYQSFGGNIELSNIKTLSYDYNTSLNFTFTQDNYNLKEYEVLFPINYSYYTNIFRKSTYESLNINFLAQYNHNILDLEYNPYKGNNYNFSLSPVYNVIANRFNIKLGANFSVYSELFSDSQDKYSNDLFKFAIHPIAEIKTYIIPDAFSFTVGIKGENYRNTINFLRSKNKYLAPINSIIPLNFVNGSIKNNPFKMTDVKYNAYCNLDTRFGKLINLSIGANLANINNLPIFHSYLAPYNKNQSESFNINRFNYVYENIQQILVTGEFVLNSNNVFFKLNGNYYINKIRNVNNSKFLLLDIKPDTYNMPEFDIMSSFVIKLLNNSLNFGLQGYVIGGIKDVKFDQSTINSGEYYEVMEMPLMYDMGFLASYKITNNVSTWLNVNNLLHFNNNKLYLYYLYPEYTINAMIGISMSF